MATKAARALPAPSLHTYTFGSVTIKFPYEAYPAQLTYMENVINALNRGENALLESPTGTGKTLCLLSATLAWVEEEKRRRKVGLPSLRQKLNVTSPSTAVFGVDAEGDGTPRVVRNPSASTTLRGTVARIGMDEKASGINQAAQQSASRVPCIFYASRTHSQLAQVVKELKRSPYEASVRVLASREQLCIHPSVRSQPAQMQQYICRSLVDSRRCRFRNGLERYSTTGINVLGSAVHDIEDLIEIGKGETVCPYFLSRLGLQQADVVFLPYNYLFDSAARNQLGIDNLLEEAIVILDEAHNLESFCSAASSFELTAVQLGKCIEELHEAFLIIEQREKDKMELPTVENHPLTAQHVLAVKSRFSNLEANILAHIEKRTKTLDDTDESASGDIRLPGPTIYKLLGDINFDTYEQFIKGLFAIINLLLEESTAAAVSSAGLASSLSVNSAAVTQVRQQMNRNLALDKFIDCLRVLFEGDKEVKKQQSQDYFRLIISPEVEPQSTSRRAVFGGQSDDSGAGAFTLSYWCFSPAIAMRKLVASRIHSLLLTSGTLSPMNSFAQELGVDFAIRLQNPHVIDPSQIFAGVIPKGPRGQALSSAFSTRSNVLPTLDLGIAISNLARLVPDGILVFFPSYGSLQRAMTLWRTADSINPSATSTSDSSFAFDANSSQNRGRSQPKRPFNSPGSASESSKYVEEQFGANSILENISLCKRVVIEPRSSAQFPAAIDYYREAVSSGFGGVFFGVCRGKASEGVDFSDAQARAVIITGIPFPNRTDPRVDLKREILDRQLRNAAGKGEVLSGAAWYSLEAARAVNQAVGRVIRHKNDFGAIFLCDERFASSSYLGQLSNWLKPRVTTYDTFVAAFQGAAQFFKAMRERFPDAFRSQGARQSGPVALSFSTKGSLSPSQATRLSSASALSTQPSDELSQAIASIASGIDEEKVLAIKRELKETGRDKAIEQARRKVRLEELNQDEAEELLLQGKHLEQRKGGKKGSGQANDPWTSNSFFTFDRTVSSVRPLSQQRDESEDASSYPKVSMDGMNVERALELARQLEEEVNRSESPEAKPAPYMRRQASAGFWILATRCCEIAKSSQELETKSDSSSLLESLQDIFARISTEDKIIQRTPTPVQQDASKEIPSSREGTHDWFSHHRLRLFRALTELAAWIRILLNTPSVLNEPMVVLLRYSLPPSYRRTLEHELLISVPGAFISSDARMRDSSLSQTQEQPWSQSNSSVRHVSHEPAASVRTEMERALTPDMEAKMVSSTAPLTPPTSAAELIEISKTIFGHGTQAWKDFVELLKQLRVLSRKYKGTSEDAIEHADREQAIKLAREGYRLLAEDIDNRSFDARFSLAQGLLVVVGKTLARIWEKEVIFELMTIKHSNGL